MVKYMFFMEVLMEQFWSKVRTEVSDVDIELSLDNWQFVQMIAERSDDKQEKLELPNGEQNSPCIIMPYDSSWQIQYWLGNEELASMMSCSAGESFLGGLTIDASTEWGSEKNHAAKAAISMVHYAQMQEWPGIIITDGSDFLKWVVWAAAESYKIPCSGYDPDSDAIARKERCDYMLSAFKNEVKIPSVSVTMGLSSSGSEQEDDQ